MRETSSRSSTSRMRWLICRSMTSVDLRRHGVAKARDLEQLQAGQERRQRVAQLVAERREELVLALVGDAQRFFGARAVLEVTADLILALAGAQGGAGRR